MSGKGSKQRPTDKQKFDEGWERVFGKNKKPVDKTPTDKYNKVYAGLAQR